MKLVFSNNFFNVRTIKLHLMTSSIIFMTCHLVVGHDEGMSAFKGVEDDTLAFSIRAGDEKREMPTDVTCQARVCARP